MQTDAYHEIIFGVFNQSNSLNIYIGYGISAVVILEDNVICMHTDNHYITVITQPFSENVDYGFQTNQLHLMYWPRFPIERCAY